MPDADSPCASDVTTSENTAPIRKQEKSTPEKCVRISNTHTLTLCTCVSLDVQDCLHWIIPKNVIIYVPLESCQIYCYLT